MGLCPSWLLHEVWVWTHWKQSPWCRIHLQPGTLGRTEGECQGGEGEATFLTLPGTGRDLGLVGFLHTLSSVGAGLFDLAADVQ